jgi:hypothetical protein
MNITGILKSKILLGIVFLAYVYFIYEYGVNSGMQMSLDNVKKAYDDVYTDKTDPDYLALLQEYTSKTNEFNSAKNTDQMVGGICGLFIFYYLFKNLK